MYLQHSSCKGVHHNHSLSVHFQWLVLDTAPLSPHHAQPQHSIGYHAKLTNLASAAETRTFEKTKNM